MSYRCKKCKFIHASRFYMRRHMMENHKIKKENMPLKDHYERMEDEDNDTNI